MRAFAEWLGNGAADAAASVVFHSEERRLLFNCSEGTQRLCIEYKVRLGKLSHVFLSRLDADTCAGFLGLMLSLADAGHAGLTMFAPRGLEKTLSTAKRFASRPQYPLHVHELGEDEPSDPLVQNPLFAVYALPWLVDEQLQRSLATQKDQVKRHCGERRDEEVPEALSSSSKNEVAERIFVTYAVRVADQKGRFVTERAAALGIPRGPLYGRLQRGESIEMEQPDGTRRTVHPTDVMEPSSPGPLLVMLCASSPDLVSQMQAPSGRQRLKQWFQRLAASTPTHRQKRPVCVFHFLCAEVFSDPQYQEWALDVFGADAYHSVACESFSNQRITFRGQAAMLERLKFVDWNWFLEPWTAPADPRARTTSALPATWQLAQPLLRFNAAPRTTLGWALPESHAAANHGWSRLNIPREPDTLKRTSSNNDSKTYSVLFLGTGSALPSRYRNVSAILVDLVDHALFLDAGEGTFGQLVRAVGLDTAKAMLLHRVRCIWISHMHADHHLGVGSLVALRTRLARELPQSERLGTAMMPLMVLGPRLLGRWLEALAELEPMSYIFLDNAALLQSDTSPLSEYFPQTLGIHLRTLPVDHCPEAYGLVLESALAAGWDQNGSKEQQALPVPTSAPSTARSSDNAAAAASWKLVYSGDTLPYDAGLIAAARGATLVIHEATFEDGKEAEALLRKHSTIGQALGTIESMQPQRAVLTHFSQRYPKLPLISSAETQQRLKANACLLAWDLMRLPWFSKDGEQAGSRTLTTTPPAVANSDVVSLFLQRLLTEFASEFEEPLEIADSELDAELASSEG